MKLFLPIALLCLLVVVSCKKADQQTKEKSHAWSEKKNHNVKKYNQEKVHHHDKHQKIHHHENPMKHESHPTEKKHKAEVHHGYHDVPKHEAELQKDVKSTKKEIADRLAKEEQDLHLQDLTHPDDPSNAGHKNHKSPHQYQRGHHKGNNHFSHGKGQKSPHHQVEDEKLFDFPESKQPDSKQSHPVLEDSFEPLSDEVTPEKPEHAQSKKKDSSKNKKTHKKAYEKVKEKTKNKENEKTKNKEDKKNKKQHNKGKKEKKQL